MNLDNISSKGAILHRDKRSLAVSKKKIPCGKIHNVSLKYRQALVE